MPAALSGQAATYANAVASYAATAPTHASGDMLVAVSWCDNDGSEAALTATGWTQMSSAGAQGGGNTAGFMKVWSRSGTGASTYTFGSSAGAASWCWIAKVTGYNAITPWQISGVYNRPAAASATALVAPSINPVGTGLLVCVWSQMATPAASAITPPAGMTGTSTHDTIPFAGSLVATQTMPAGATGTRTATAASSGNSSTNGYLAASFMISDASTASSAAGTSAVMVNAAGTVTKRVSGTAGASPIVVNSAGAATIAPKQGAGAAPIVVAAAGTVTQRAVAAGAAPIVVNSTGSPALRTGASGAAPIVVNSTGSAALAVPKLETLVDDFSAVRSDLWTNLPAAPANPGVSGGQASFLSTTSYPGTRTVKTYTLLDSYVHFQVNQNPTLVTPSNGFHFRVEANQPATNNNHVRWNWDNSGRWFAVYEVNGTDTVVGPAGGIDLPLGGYLRIRESAGTCYWDYSADGTSWTNQGSWNGIRSGTADYSGVQLSLFAGYFNGADTAPTVPTLIDNVNVPTNPVYQAAGTSAVVISASGAVTPVLGASGTVPIVLGSAGTVTERLTASGTAPVVIGSSGSATAIQPPQAAGSAPIVISSTGNATVRSGATGAAAIVINSAGSAEILPAIRGTAPIVISSTGDVTVPILAASGSAPIAVGSTGSPSQVFRVSGTSPIVIGTSGLAGRGYSTLGTSSITISSSGNPIVQGQPDQGEEIIALFDEDEVLEGGRVTFYGFDLLDSDENYIGQLESVQAGSIDIDAYASVKSTGKLTVFNDPRYADYPENQPAFYGGEANTPTGVVVQSTSTSRNWYSGAYTQLDGAELVAMGDWRGRPMDVSSVFPARESPAAMASPWWLNDDVSPSSVPVVALGIAMCTNGQTIAQDLTSTMTSMANSMLADGRIFMIRLGWEFNLPTSTWAWAVTDANVTQWKSRFNQYANIFKSILGAKCYIILNPNIGGFQSAYTGTMDALITGLNFDAIGPDAYDWYPPMTSDANIVTQHTMSGLGLDYFATTARALGKKLCLPEWGVASGTAAAGNQGMDNPRYISAMKTWMDANADIMLFDAYFNEDQAYIKSDIFKMSGPANNPDAGTRYQQLFSSTAYFVPGVSGQAVNVNEGDTVIFQDSMGNQLSPNVYTVDYVDQADYGLQDVYFDKPLPTIVAGTALVVVTGGQAQVASWLNLRIRPMIRIQRLGGGDDDEGRIVAAGVYTVAAPDEDWSATGLTRELELTDKLGILDQDIASGSASSITAYTALAGANIIALVQALIAETGETYPAIRPDTKTLAAPMLWDIGTTRLKIINDLLDAAGYFSLWCDGWGQYRAEPYVTPANRVPVYESIAPFSSGPRSLMDPNWNRGRDYYSVPNRYFLVGQGDGTTAALTSTATNVDPNSPYSFPNRGRWITVVETGVEAADQAALDAIARSRLSSASSVVDEFTVDHAYLPDLTINSVVKMVVPQAGVDFYCYVVATTIPLSPTALAATTMRVVQA